jgi:ribosomal protein S18 acetylase RimI-like enzyme
VTIRDVRWEDFPSIVEYYYALYDEVQENTDLGIGLFKERPALSAEVAWFADFYCGVLEGEVIAVVAEEEGRAVGHCSVRPSASPESRHCGVLAILVARSWRGRGIGKALMQGALERCRGKLEIVELTVFASNLHARHLYQSLGFRPAGVVPRFVLRQGKYTDVERMVLDLGPAHASPAVS